MKYQATMEWKHFFVEMEQFLNTSMRNEAAFVFTWALGRR
jgi:hypothetical protein